MRFVLFLLAGLVTVRGWSADFSSAIPADCRAVALLTSSGWSSSTGALRRFERDSSHAAWRPVGAPMKVLLGKHGLAWGWGMVAPPDDAAPHKVEGDLCSPAGIFAFGTAFGRAPRSEVPWLRMPYLALSPAVEAVDDPASRFYNRIVDRTRVAQPDWRSSEHMGKAPAYALGIVIAANPQCIPKAGSCVFLHLWTKGRIGTSGCTALQQADLLELLRWLDPAKQPVLVQLPEPVAKTSLSGFQRSIY